MPKAAARKVVTECLVYTAVADRLKSGSFVPRWQQLIERLQQVLPAQPGLFLFRLSERNNLRVRVDQQRGGK